jgi:hypothetical protein
MADQNKTVTFISRKPGLILWIRVPEKPEVTPLGRLNKPGDMIEFEGHEYKTDDEKDITEIRKSAVFNTMIWEQGNAPDEPKPTVKSQLSKISRARSVKTVEAVIDEEKATHSRAVVLDAAQDRLEALAEDGKQQEKKPSTSKTSENS